jgi:hypothetical protein
MAEKGGFFLNSDDIEELGHYSSLQMKKRIYATAVLYRKKGFYSGLVDSGAVRRTSAPVFAIFTASTKFIRSRSSMSIGRTFNVIRGPLRPSDWERLSIHLDKDVINKVEFVRGAQRLSTPSGCLIIIFIQAKVPDLAEFVANYCGDFIESFICAAPTTSTELILIKYATTGGKKAPLCGKRAPLSGKKAPLGGKRAPLCEKRAPLGGKKAPLGGKRAPLSGKRAPAGKSAARRKESAALRKESAALRKESASGK